MKTWATVWAIVACGCSGAPYEPNVSPAQDSGNAPEIAVTPEPDAAPEAAPCGCIRGGFGSSECSIWQHTGDSGVHPQEYECFACPGVSQTPDIGGCIPTENKGGGDVVWCC